MTRLAPLARRDSSLQRPRSLAVVAAAADSAAARSLYTRYRQRLAAETLRRQDADLACFATYLATVGAPAGDLLEPASWAGLTWGVVEGFVAWQLREGYAVGSVNVRLSTVKTYARLAAKAGALAADAYSLIALVGGYRAHEGQRLDARRETTRKGEKKAQATSVSAAQAAQLLAGADARDQLLLCIFLDLGLRVGEAALLTAEAFDLAAGVVTVVRPKVHKTQTHRLSERLVAAARAYLPDAPRRSLFGGDRAIRARLAKAGQAIGLAALSPHDLRHAWATRVARSKTPIKAFQDAGGWNSPAMPLRYAESAAVANDGVELT